MRALPGARSSTPPPACSRSTAPLALACSSSREAGSFLGGSPPNKSARMTRRQTPLARDWWQGRGNCRGTLACTCVMDALPRWPVEQIAKLFAVRQQRVAAVIALREEETLARARGDELYDALAARMDAMYVCDRLEGTGERHVKLLPTAPRFEACLLKCCAVWSLHFPPAANAPRSAVLSRMHSAVLSRMHPCRVPPCRCHSFTNTQTSL